MIVLDTGLVINHGGCNFCDRATLHSSGRALVYPYDYVYLIKSDGKTTSVRICKECSNELTEKLSKAHLS